NPGLSLKAYPCAYASHRGIDAVLRIRSDHGVTFDDVVAVRCEVPPGGLRTLIYPVPTTGLESKFSMHYSLARGIVDGRFGLAAFSDAAVREPAIARALGMITVVEDETCWPVESRSSGGQSPGTRGFVRVHV